MELNTWQRFMLSQIVGGLRGDIQTVRTGLKLLEILELSDSEKQQVGFVEDKTGAHWEDTEYRFELEIKDENLVAFLRTKATEFQGWPVNKNSLDLFDQLGVTEGE